MTSLRIQHIHAYDLQHRVLEPLYAALQQNGCSRDHVTPKAMLSIITAWEEIRSEEKARDLPGNEGPAAHEDLTIAEQIALLATVEKDGDGMLTFQSPAGVCELPEDHVGGFLEEHGHEHAAEYQEKYGCRWEDDFFILRDVV